MAFVVPRKRQWKQRSASQRNILYLWWLSLLAFLLLKHYAIASHVRLDLHPTSAALHHHADDRPWRRHVDRTNSTIDSSFANQNAVYATIPCRHDPRHANNRHLQEFHALRHLSRYERQHRIQNGHNLDRNWNGTYNFEILNESSDTRRLQESTSYGGQFDNYQAVTLSQGYGTHFANVWVGTPVPQRKTVIVDTGSHYTAFPCAGCSGCGAPHHTDPYFDPQKSKSFHLLQCDECRDGVSCQNGECLFSQSYTEGSSWEAVQVKDRFYCGGTDVLDSVDPQDEKYSLNFMFGCQIRMTGLFITQLADGIMGMSAHPATLPKQLYERQIIEHNLFAMCFRRELGTSKRGVTAGSMTLGGYSNSLDTSPMIYAKNMASVGWFTVYVKNIFIRSGGGQSAKSRDLEHKTIRVRMNPISLNSGKGVIVDSGTTDTYLNKVVAREFNKAWKRATGRQYSHTPIYLTAEQLRSLPTILVQCHGYTRKSDPSIDDYGSIPGYAGELDKNNPNDLLIAIPATSYMDYSPITKLYTSRVYFTETSGGVLGSNAMQGHNVVFDWENGRIGFAESSCTYDKKDVPKAALDEGYSADCLVGNPILAQPCIDTVERRLCERNPTNIALLGTETWVAVVESAGSETGLSCVESTKERTSSANGADKPVIRCNGDGLCEERRPCQLTCSQLERAEKATPVSASESDRLGCGDSYWSACDYSCKQSRIKSVAYSDGVCHEVSRETRSCHIGACARSDPCRVPFLVHAVIGFRGASVSKWSMTAEDNFATAMTRASYAVSQSRLFEEGDINIFAALPWYPDDENGPDDYRTRHAQEGEGPEPHGFKIVLEISIFNPLAKFGNNTAIYNAQSVGNDGKEDTLTAMLQNITNRFNRGSAKATCNPDDLHSLAKKALHLKKEVLGHKQFMSKLIGELKRIEGERATAFGPVFREDHFASESRLLSSWSIRTEIDEEINFYGPVKPWWFKFLSFLHTLAFAFVAFMVLMTMWSLLIMCHDTSFVGVNCGWLKIPPWKKRQRYLAVNLNDDDTNNIEATIMGASVVEMTVQSPGLKRYRGTSPKKRRSTINSMRSNSDL